MEFPHDRSILTRHSRRRTRIIMKTPLLLIFQIESGESLKWRFENFEPEVSLSRHIRALSFLAHMDHFFFFFLKAHKYFWEQPRVRYSSRKQVRHCTQISFDSSSVLNNPHFRVLSEKFYYELSPSFHYHYKLAWFVYGSQCTYRNKWTNIAVVKLTTRNRKILLFIQSCYSFFLLPRVKFHFFFYSSEVWKMCERRKSMGRKVRSNSERKLTWNCSRAYKVYTEKKIW